MSDQDIPLLDEEISRLPSDIRLDLANRGRNDLFFFNKAILGYNRLTKRCHGPLCTFVTHNPKRFKLVLMPRDHYKTTNITIGGNIQKIVRNVEERILIANENGTNASRFLDAIKSHAEGNKIFRTLYSEIIPKDFRKTTWNSLELKFNRKGHYPEPTVDCIGMTGTMTSRHYTHICVDDPISEEAVKSEKVMHDVITRIDKVFSLLVDPEKDSFWLVGTRWAFNDIYSFFIKKLGHRFAIFARGAIEDGEPIFPELITMETLADIRDTIGEYAFSCLYMNNPRDPAIQDFNIEDLRFWRFTTDEKHVVLYDREGEICDIWPLNKLDITTTIDPAVSEKITSDRNAIVTTGISPKGQCIVLEAWAKRCTPLEVIEHMFWVQERFHPRAFGIEGVAYQKALKYFVRQEASRRNVYLRIEELRAPGHNKAHIKGLQPIAATGRLYVQPTMHVLRTEFSEWPLGEHDDAIDCLALQQQMWRGLMSPQRWDKYKESERRLLARLDGYDAPEPKEDEDEDDSDGRPGEWREYVFG